MGSPPMDDVHVPDKKPIAAIRHSPVGGRSTGALPVPASADPELAARFDARTHRLFALLDAALADGPPTPAAIATLREALHQVAGTAAFFGKADLGVAAATIDDQLRDHRLAMPDFLHDARAALRRIALGE